MSQYFYEDQVYTIDKKGNIKFGLVVENEVHFQKNFPFQIRNNQFSCEIPKISLDIDKTNSLI